MSTSTIPQNVRAAIWAKAGGRCEFRACNDDLVGDLIAGKENGLYGFIAHIDAKEAGILVFTIPFDKGFSATIDGRQADVIPCDVSFMGVWVEPGEHEIVFTYRTRALPLGAALSALAAAMLAAYVFICRRRGK